MSKKFDIVVMGGGPGGYVAAIRAAQLGKSVAVVEKEALGGICLNWGCIPTKSLLKDSEVLHLVKNADKYGIDVDGYSVNFGASVKRSRRVAKRLSKGIEYLLKKNKIEYIAGTAFLKSATEVEVAGAKGKKKTVIQSDNVIIATGARNREFPGLETDGKRVISSKEAMVLDDIPKSMIIIGAGAIGAEFASLYSEYGTEIHLVEMLPGLLPMEDVEISKLLRRLFEDRGMNVHTSAKVEKIERLKTKVKVNITKEDGKEVIEAQMALVAIGVQGNVERLGLEKAGVNVDKNYIQVNEVYQTSVPNIYAIGDVIGAPWLAHVASAEGRVAAEYICAKQPEPLNYGNIPGCTYCRPQVASVGMTEKAATDAGYTLKIGRFPMRASGKALALGEPEGFVKVIFDEKYGELLGCHIIGPEATELIAEAGAVRTLETTHEEILRTVHAHPTISESFMEAVADAYDEAIHI
ncbi:MAG TPA: dihydrolipoyl dehydrogenase [Candidatus Marinimicrobia bacterium]|jgi:dihydrolipoamide dehydrogenase|nr:dihydrolipoyl dehydrogenase [Candidatus Neomarinimicrobiota bacterium]HJM10172.1 dihydrolipoyl dehydrogenase [Candidatus Neomarinimicrobiota bacterium]HJM85372.1 dihydrolipoyl dehydrogenase [Candidatus Neomarinimicrobiota bacterium]|tara:strand:+ start:3759 stop:5156 length:1398 start_codon:yes stop_codon:yes gene_type:complete